MIHADIKAGYRTDHSRITTTFGKETKRNVFWKFNSSLLKDKAYVDKINSVVKYVIEEYAALRYIREKLLHIPKFEIRFVISAQLLLAVLLMKI